MSAIRKTALNKMAKSHEKLIQSTHWGIYRSILGRVTSGSTNPIIREINGTIRNQDIPRLVELAGTLTRQKYSSASEHFEAYQVAGLIKKYPFTLPGAQKVAEANAEKTFLEGEARCAETNRKFEDPSFIWENEAVLQKMRSFISYVIGEQPNLNSIFDQIDFGPGASIGVHGNATNVGRKILQPRWSVTPSAFHYACRAAIHSHSFLEILFPQGKVIYDWDHVVAAMRRHVDIVHYNNIAFVEKTFETKRTIGVGPTLNGLLQKGVDGEMRKFLKRIRIDLSDQSRNQFYALWGSQDHLERSGFVTIDLRNASGNIASGCVKNLFPYDWWSLLDDLRERYYMLNGTEFRYEMMCSMGNGFCFPLETLIFVAACHAAGAGSPHRDFSVYGDDIIVRKDKAADVIAVLELLGFEVNTSKTFLDGPFRESCGADFFSGEDVRPFILDFVLDSIPDMFKFLNLTQRNARTRAFFADCRDMIFSLIPAELQFVRPYPGPDDTAVTVPLDRFMASPYARWLPGVQTWQWVEFKFSSVRDNISESDFTSKDWAAAQMFAALRGNPSDAPFTLRRKTRRQIGVNITDPGRGYKSPTTGRVLDMTWWKGTKYL
ncbi:MAG: RNA replicase beta chain [Sanya solspi-like virus 3]|nr:MAG: RNA replicase beta chain [Sanya solspi-like virus 3]